MATNDPFDHPYTILCDARGCLPDRIAFSNRPNYGHFRPLYNSSPKASWECHRCHKVNAPWKEQCDCE